MQPDNAAQGPAWLPLLPIFAQNVLKAQDLIDVLDDSSSRKFVKLSMLRAAGLLEGHIAKLSFLLDWTFVDSTHEDIDDDGNGDGNSTNPGESNSTTQPPQGTTVKEKRAVRMSDFDDLFQATWVAEVRSHLALFSPCSLQASFVADHQRDEVAP